jgi:hypothetical protein
MDPRILVYIYFIGIAAVVNVSPYNNVTKAVVFPATPAGVTYQGVTLAPHQAWLYVKGLENPTEDCAKVSGTVVNGICKATLKGANLWVSPSEPLTEDSYFRKIPSFMKWNPSAKDLPDDYVAQQVDPNIVAARFDIKGGKLSGCNRKGAAFVTKIETLTNDGTLYVRQAERTVRLVLTKSAVIAIENKPEDASMTMRGEDHYGWYYVMNKRSTDQPPLLFPTAPPSGPPDCPFIAGADDFMTTMASAECGVTNYP